MTRAEQIWTVYTVILFVSLSNAIVDNQGACSQLSHQNNNNQCSSNAACTCLYFPDGIKQQNNGVCALSPMKCSELIACERNFTCIQPDMICVKYTRCGDRFGCHRLATVTSEVCPTQGLHSQSGNTALKRSARDGICKTATWASVGKTVAGGNGPGAALNQLTNPFGIFIDSNDGDALIIVDSGNGRVMKWKQNASSGQVVAGGNGEGNRSNQLALPRYVTVDNEGTLFITEYTNKRVNRWKKNAEQGEIIIANISANGITLGFTQGGQQHLFVGDWFEAHILKFDKDGIAGGQVVVGGKGPGSSLEQLRTPYQMRIDQEGSILVPEYLNNRVTKWSMQNGSWATSAIIIAGGNGNGSGLNQLDGTLSVALDQSDTVYVADYGNHRIMRLKEGQNATIIAGGQGQGDLSTQLNHPYDLAFDQNGNLYVSDFSNHRIQMFAIDKSSCNGSASRTMIGNQFVASLFSISVLILHCTLVTVKVA